MGEKKRASFYVDKTLEASIEKLKKEKFFNKSYSEMYRYLINLGVEQMKVKKNGGV